MNFGGIDPEYDALEKVAFVVVPVPYDLTTTYQGGARKGPSAILEASCNMELYDEELEAEIYKAGIHTLAPIPGMVAPDFLAARLAYRMMGYLSKKS